MGTFPHSFLKHLIVSDACAEDDKEKTVKTERVSAKIDRSFLLKHTEQFADFIEAMKELVWNAIDHKANSVVITYERLKTGLNVHVLDDGQGISVDGRKAVVSIDYSPSAEDASKRGKNGNGSKGGFHHCRTLQFQTRVCGEGSLRTVGYTIDELLEMWEQGYGDWDISEPPADHPIRVSGTRVSLLSIGTGAPEVQARHDRSAARLIAELGQKLPTSVARCVTVIDEHGRSSKLKPKQLKGKMIEGEGHIPGIGPVSYSIGVVSNPEDHDERLAIWALDYICEIYAFLSRIRPTSAMATLLRSLHSFLEHPLVSGSITMPELNRLTSSTGRKEFKQELYDDEDKIYAILRYFHEEILPKLEAVLGKASERVRETDTETMRIELVKHLQELGGMPSSQTPVVDVDMDALKVTPARFEVEPGDQMSIEITANKSNKTIQWNAAGSGGRLDRTTGTKVTFTAGAELGTFTLSATDGDNSISIPIEIVRELPFGFVTTVRYAQRGQRITLQLKNTKRTSGMFQWNDSECGGTLVVSDDTHTAVYEAGEEIGDFKVQVTESNPSSARLTRRATCTINVTKAKERPRPRRPSDSVFAYPKGGLEYELRIKVWDTPELVDVASYYSKATPNNPHGISLNIAHSCFMGQSHKVTQMAAFTQIALRIAQVELTAAADFSMKSPDEALTALQRRASAILADFITGRAST